MPSVWGPRGPAFVQRTRERDDRVVVIEGLETNVKWRKELLINALNGSAQLALGVEICASFVLVSRRDRRPDSHWARAHSPYTSAFPPSGGFSDRGGSTHIGSVLSHLYRELGGLGEIKPSYVISPS